MKKLLECKCGNTVKMGSRANINKEIPENYSIFCSVCVRRVTTENQKLTLKIWEKMSKMKSIVIKKNLLHILYRGDKK